MNIQKLRKELTCLALKEIYLNLLFSQMFFDVPVDTSLSYNETLAIYLKEDVGKENNPETIIFYVDSCEKQDDIVGKHFNIK